MGSTRMGWAKAPAHVTGFFLPALESPDPRGRGSIGAGLVLELGVHARALWRPAVRRSVRLHADLSAPMPISTDAAKRILGERPGRLDVTLRHELPVGQGFGMSAAGALATSLAVAEALELPRARAVEAAHLADLSGGGGLGGVSAILGGGLEIRRRPGIPPWGEAAHFPMPNSVFVVIAGPPMPTARVLADQRVLLRASAGALRGIRRVLRTPTLPRFFEEAERFTDTVGVAPPNLVRLLTDMRGTGCWAAQAMFGRALFALPRRPAARAALVREIVRRRLSGVEIRIARAGASGGAGAAPTRKAF